MKKSNPHRQKLLQRKRTKRNQSRKGKVYNSKPQSTATVESNPAQSITDQTVIRL